MARRCQPVIVQLPKKFPLAKYGGEMRRGSDRKTFSIGSIIPELPPRLRLGEVEWASSVGHTPGDAPWPVVNALKSIEASEM
jgi:hypothetical protein